VAASIPLRAHNVLCLQGFRGRGYDAAFVARMADVKRTLDRDSARTVRLLDGPDRICEACPNLTERGCGLGGRPHEDHMRAQDRDVLRRLGFRAGDEVAWGDVLSRIGSNVRGSDLPVICTTCPWLSLGWCAEGIDSLGRTP
jgi:hypothetical protein